MRETDFETLPYQLTAERDGYLAERDAYIKQFDELSRLKHTEVEKNYSSYRHKAEERASSACLVYCVMPCSNLVDATSAL